MREIVYDTETTGLSPGDDRIVEIAAIELIDRLPTGKSFHTYINPGRRVPMEATNIHGLTNEFLRDKPRFDQVSGKFLVFIGHDPLIAHNAQFDMGFVNMELALIDVPPLKNEVIDTLAMARFIKPGGKHSLDIMCSYYGIDKSARVKHGALIDCHLLAEVYLNMRGGRQAKMVLDGGAMNVEAPSVRTVDVRQRSFPGPTSEELERHAVFVAEMGDKAIWNDYKENSIA